MRIYGIIGHPITHSLSPAMQNAAFKALSIDAEYHVYDVAPADLEYFLKDIVQKGISGLNVTIPHKIKAKEFIEHIGSLNETARRLGAINTIKVEGGKLFGYNTDGPGFYRSLIEDLKFEPEGRTIFVLGAGGAATSIIMYLGNGPEKIFVTDVDYGKAIILKKHYNEYCDENKLETVKMDELKSHLDKCQLLINATPIGMKDEDGLPIDKDMLHPGLYIYDLIYNRPATRLVGEANRMKLHAVNGLGMLLYQGALSFELWTGLKAPIAVMKKALREALKK